MVHALSLAEPNNLADGFGKNQAVHLDVLIDGLLKVLWVRACPCGKEGGENNLFHPLHSCVQPGELFQISIYPLHRRILCSDDSLLDVFCAAREPPHLEARCQQIFAGLLAHRTRCSNDEHTLSVARSSFSDGSLSECERSKGRRQERT